MQLFDMTNVLNAISSNNYSVLDTTTYQDNSTAILDSCTNSLSASSQIDKTEIDNAGLSASRLINIIQCSELNQLQSSMWITWLQNEIGKLSEKMWNVSIDWKNINVTQMLLNNPIQNIIHFNEYVPLKETFTKDDLKKIRDLAEEMNSMWKTIRNNRTNLENFKTKLEEIKQSYESWGWLTNEVENMINSIYNNVSYLIEFTRPWWEMDNLSNYVRKRRNFSETTAASQVIWHWLSNNLIQMVAAIWCAVAVMCAIPSWGTSLLGVAALSTLAWMWWSRIWQRTNERLHNFQQEVVIDGKRYTIDYDNPTDIEMFLTWELWWEEFLFNICFFQ